VDTEISIPWHYWILTIQNHGILDARKKYFNRNPGSGPVLLLTLTTKLYCSPYLTWPYAVPCYSTSVLVPCSCFGLRPSIPPKKGALVYCGQIVTHLNYSAVLLFVCLCAKYLLNHWTDLSQIHTEDVFGRSLGWVWMLRSKVKCQGHQGQSSSPLKMHCNSLAANNITQQQKGPFRHCWRVMGVHSRDVCGLSSVKHL